MNQPGTQIAGPSSAVRPLSAGDWISLQLKSHEVKFGGSYQQYTIRRYNPTSEISWYKMRKEATSYK